MAERERKGAPPYGGTFVAKSKYGTTLGNILWVALVLSIALPYVIQWKRNGAREPV